MRSCDRYESPSTSLASNNGQRFSASFFVKLGWRFGNIKSAQTVIVFWYFLNEHLFARLRIPFHHIMKQSQRDY